MVKQFNSKMKNIVILSIVGVLSVTVFALALAKLNSPTSTTNTNANATANGQTGTAQVVLSKGLGTLETGQTVDIGINAGILRNTIMTDLLFAKIVIIYDQNKIALVADPQLITSDWKNPIYAQTKAEVENKNPGKIILISALDENQQPIDFRSKFAKLVFKKINPNQTGTTYIGFNFNGSQIVNSPAQETSMSSNRLTLSL